MVGVPMTARPRSATSRRVGEGASGWPQRASSPAFALAGWDRRTCAREDTAVPGCRAPGSLLGGHGAAPAPDRLKAGVPWGVRPRRTCPSPQNASGPGFLLSLPLAETAEFPRPLRLTIAPGGTLRCRVPCPCPFGMLWGSPDACVFPSGVAGFAVVPFTLVMIPLSPGRSDLQASLRDLEMMLNQISPVVKPRETYQETVTAGQARDEGSWCSGRLPRA